MPSTIAQHICTFSSHPCSCVAGGQLIGYELDESKGWGMNIPAIRDTIHEQRKAGLAVRGLVFINPGNPTGQCLSRENLAELCQLAYEEQLVLMADEVYQENIYVSCPLCRGLLIARPAQLTLDASCVSALG